MGIPDVDPERKEKALEASDESTMTGPTEKDLDSGDISTVGETPETPTENEYPSGIRLVFVLLAIVFSVFLLALDQVSKPNPQISRKVLTLQDDSSYRNPQNHR